MVRVGVIGTGFGAKVHAPGWKSVPNATLVGIAGRTEKKVLTAAKKHTIRPYTSWQELVRDPSIDLVDIVVPPHLQAEILIAACES